MKYLLLLLVVLWPSLATAELSTEKRNQLLVRLVEASLLLGNDKKEELRLQAYELGWSREQVEGYFQKVDELSTKAIWESYSGVSDEALVAQVFILELPAEISSEITAAAEDYSARLRNYVKELNGE